MLVGFRSRRWMIALAALLLLLAGFFYLVFQYLQNDDSLSFKGVDEYSTKNYDAENQVRLPNAFSEANQRATWCWQEKLELCDQNFQIVFSKISQAETLTPEDVSLVLDNPRLYAVSLKNSPESMARLLMSIQQDEVTYLSEQDAAYAIIEVLNADEKIDIAEQIFSTQYDEYRISGLKLLESTLDSRKDAVHMLASVIETEIDTRVFAVALNMSQRVVGEENRQIVRDALTSVIESSFSAYISGEALMAKMELSSSFGEVSTEVYELITNYTTDYRDYGLQALEVSLDRYHEEFEVSGGWRKDNMMRAAVDNIAQDQSADTALRNRAQDILEDYF